ncbi:unnamed protein product [Dovyalis caffra]|uniref:Uncharacterized protein n=1 Tax=Dovyalis caffra TaxID=77055 RepID=A0AAV1RWH2_9ROSI|nr:unnamed protein product [Dovyalis caffra]
MDEKYRKQTMRIEEKLKVDITITLVNAKIKKQTTEVHAFAKWRENVIRLWQMKKIGSSTDVAICSWNSIGAMRHNCHQDDGSQGPADKKSFRCIMPKRKGT